MRKIKVLRRIIKKTKNRKISAKKNLMKIRKNRRAGQGKLRLNFNTETDNFFDIQTIIIVVLIVLLSVYIVKELFFTDVEEIVIDETQKQKAVAWFDISAESSKKLLPEKMSDIAGKIAGTISDDILPEIAATINKDEDGDISRTAEYATGSFKNVSAPVFEKTVDWFDPDLPLNKYRQRVNPELIRGKTLIAIIIDDVGIGKDKTSELIAFEYPLTLSFLPYGKNTDTSHISDAIKNGHEVMLHVPMEPKGNYDAGENVLKVGMNQTDIYRNFEEMLKNAEGFVGVNNHMGSKFTSDRAAMEIFLDLVKEKGFLFVDSKTLNSSLGGQIADEKRIPFAVRDIFLDHLIDEQFIKRQLTELEHIAKKYGYALGIGHPHRATINALREWLPVAAERGVAFVPISHIVDLNYQKVLAEKGEIGKISLKSMAKNAKND